MLNLILTTDKVSVISGSSGDLDTHASFVDVDTATGAVFTPGKQNANITTATTTDIVAAPSTTYRNIKWISIRNAHASTANDVTVQFNANGTLYELVKCTLLAGEELVCREGVWFHFDSNGGVYASASVSAPIIVKSLSADVTNSTTTAAKITGLDAVVAPGNYMFRYNLIYQAGATTTGVKFSVNHTGTVTRFVYWWYGMDNTATAATAAADQDALAATGQVFFGFAARAKSTAAGIGPSISVDTLNADMLAVVEGQAVVTVSGNLELYHASEVAAASTVIAGSSLLLVKAG